MQVDSIVGRLRKFYALLIGVIVAAVSSISAIDGPSHYSLPEWANISLGVGILGLVYFGLRRRRPWLVPLLLFCSAYSIIPAVVGGTNTFVGIILDLGWASLALFQLWFFRLPDVRQVFGSDATTVF
jgi:hypothetical protein